MVESDDDNIWFYATEYSHTDVWFLDPATNLFTNVISVTSSFPFDSINDVTTDGAGSQWCCYNSGGFGPTGFAQFNDAGTRGTNVGGGGATVIFVAGKLLTVKGANTVAVDAYTGAAVWSVTASDYMQNMECVGPDGFVYGRNGAANILSKIDPATGSVTNLLTTTSSFGHITHDGTHMWVFDGNNVLKFDTSGTVLNTYTLPGAAPTWVELTHRPYDGKMYIAGVQGSNMPLWSIVISTGTIATELTSVFTSSTTKYSLSFFTHSDGKRMYLGTSGSTGGFYSDASLLLLDELIMQIVGDF
jgi:hypothetical protein